MHRFLNNVRESYESHFHDKTELRAALTKQFFVNTVIAFSYVLILTYISKDALVAIITLLSIIIGFSYSIMIFVSSNPFVRSRDESDRESKLRAARLNELVEKLYKNLDFFCRFSLLMVLLSVLGITSGRLLDGPFLELSVSKESKIYLTCFANFAFVWLLVELWAEFRRILERTNYLFSSRIKQFRG